MRIALCKSMLAGPVSGADEIMVNYATHLHEAGHEVMVVLLYPPAPSDQYYKRLRSAGIDVLCVVETSALYAMLRTVRDLFFSLFFFYLVPRSFERLRKFWQIVHRMVARMYVRRCRRFFTRHSPTLLHVFTPDAGAMLMIRAGHECGIPVLYHEMGTPHYMPALDVYYKELAKVLPLCEEFAALSPLLAEQWTERFPFLKSVSVLPLLMDDCDGLVRMPDSRMRPEETVFGFAARIEEGKGPLNLVEALDKLKHEEGAAALVRMAGTGPQLQDVKARVRALNLSDACEFVGFYTEPVGRSAFMRSLDVFVLPSLAEGTPNSIIEAMAHGLPVIATEIGGIPDLLSADSGILVPPGDTAALAEAMRRLASDPHLRSAMGRAARERYLKLSSPDAVLPMLQNTYRRLAGARIAPREGTRRACAHPWEVASEF